VIAVIIGGTGLTGKLLTRKLLEDPGISGVTFVCRRPVSFNHPKLKEILVPDFSLLQNESEKLKGGFYFCCLGTTLKAAGSEKDFEKIDDVAVMTFAKIAKHHGAQCMSVISASGASSRSRFFYNRVKGRVEEQLKELHFNRLVIFKPSLLIGKRNDFRLAERIAVEIITKLSFILPASFRKRLTTHSESLSARMKVEGIKTDQGVFIFEAHEI
jgi:uncharacterized protein YbjT (DUF2867 family)